MKRACLALLAVLFASPAYSQFPDPQFAPGWNNHGRMALVPPYPGDPLKLLRGDGSWAVLGTLNAPAGSSGQIQYNAGGVFGATSLPSSGILKGGPGPAFLNAVAGTDFLLPTGNGSGLIGLLASQIGSVPAGLLKGSAGAFAAAAAADVATVAAGSATPVVDGAAIPGTSNLYARQDHVHPTDTSRAPLASPTFTGTPAAPTAAVDTSTTQLATTAYVVGQAASATPLVDGTAAAGTSTRFARGDHVHPTDTSRAAVASPTFTGTPAAPTATVDTNTTQLATTAYYAGQKGTANPLAAGTATPGTSLRFTPIDHVHPTDTTRTPTTRTITAGTGLSGGGDLSADRTISLITPVALTNGGSGQATALAARGSAGFNIESGTGHGDSIYTILSTDRWVYTNAAFTAARTWTLPAANAVNPGTLLIVGDAQNTVTATNTLTLSRAGADTINNGATSFVIDVAGGRVILISDGVSKWTAHIQRPFGTAAGNAVSLDSSAHLPAVDGSALTGLTKTQVGLGSVDNTSDATKNSATATLTNKTIDTAGPNTLKVAGVDLSTGWTSYTPTVTTSVNSPPTTASATGLYKTIGKTVYFAVQVSITTNGTAAGELRFTLPVNVASSGFYYGMGREEGLTNNWCFIRFASDNPTLASAVTTTNAYPGGNGAVIRASGTYQSQ